MTHQEAPIHSSKEKNMGDKRKQTKEDNTEEEKGMVDKRKQTKEERLQKKREAELVSKNYIFFCECV